MARQPYGEMYRYTGTELNSVVVTSAYHAMVYMTSIPATSVNGWTYQIGSSISISAVSSVSGVVVDFITGTAAHGWSAGEPITIVSSDVAYNDRFVISSVPTTSSIRVTIASAGATATATAYKPSYLKASTGSAGTYLLTFNATIKVNAAGKSIKVEASKNASGLDNIAGEQVAPNNTESEMAASGLVNVSDGDYVYMTYANLTDTTAILMRHANLNVVRL